jgi:hypothetical protein
VSSSGSVWTIDNTAVTYAKIQDVAANSFLANVTGSPASMQAIATTRIPLFAGAITGTPSSTTFLRGDGTWATPSGSVSLPNQQIARGTGTGITSSSNFLTDDDRVSIGSALLTQTKLGVTYTINSGTDNFVADFRSNSTGSGIGYGVRAIVNRGGLNGIPIALYAESNGFEIDGSFTNLSIAGKFFARDAVNNYAVQLQDGSQALNRILTDVVGDGSANWSPNINISGTATFINTTINGSLNVSPDINTTAGDSATINKIAGRFRKDNSGSTFTLTNSFITANSIIILQMATTGITTGNQFVVVAGTGTATITFQNSAGVATAPSGNVDINFWVIN